MTDQRESTSNEAVITEALGVIDAALGKMMARDLVSSGEVTDLLLFIFFYLLFNYIFEVYGSLFTFHFPSFHFTQYFLSDSFILLGD